MHKFSVGAGHTTGLFFTPSPHAGSASVATAALALLKKRANDALQQYNHLKNSDEFALLISLIPDIANESTTHRLKQFYVRFHSISQRLQACLETLQLTKPNVNHYVAYLRLTKEFHDIGIHCHQLFASYQQDMADMQAASDTIEFLYQEDGLEKQIEQSYTLVLSALAPVLQQLGFVSVLCETNTPQDLAAFMHNVESCLMPAWLDDINQTPSTSKANVLAKKLTLAGQAIRLYDCLKEVEAHQHHISLPVQKHFIYKHFIDQHVWQQFETASSILNHLLKTIASKHANDSDIGAMLGKFNVDKDDELVAWLENVVNTYKPALSDLSDAPCTQQPAHTMRSYRK